MIKTGKQKPTAIIIALLSLLAVIAFLLVALLFLHMAQNEEKIENGKSETIKGSEEVAQNKETYHVVIETAHGTDENGKWDPGCSWNGSDEADLMLPITKAMTKYLRQNGVDVYTDADNDNDRNLFATLDYLDSHDVDAFVNVHCDYEEAESGTLALYHTDAQKDLCESLNKSVHEIVAIPDKGLCQRDDLDTLCSEKVHCVSCLFETGCISKDYEVLRYEFDDYGRGLAKGLCDYLGIPFNEK